MANQGMAATPEIYPHSRRNASFPRQKIHMYQVVEHSLAPIGRYCLLRSPLGDRQATLTSAAQGGLHGLAVRTIHVRQPAARRWRGFRLTESQGDGVPCLGMKGAVFTFQGGGELQHQRKRHSCLQSVSVNGVSNQSPTWPR